MRDRARIPEILKIIHEVWSKYPDLRLGQLMIIVAGKANGKMDLFDIEDDLMKEALKKIRDEH